MSVLPRTVRTDVERTLLHDRSQPLTDRIPHPDSWGNIPLRTDAEVEIRDVLTAIETKPAERVDAAVALATLSLRFRPEAIGWLEQLSGDRRTAFEARKAMAKLGHELRQDVMTEAQRILVGAVHSSTERRRAIELLVDLTPTPTGPFAEYLRDVASDERTSDQQRIEALFALRHADGLSRIRTICADEQASPVIRWRAARKLRDRTVEDRAAAARTLNAIAIDRTVRPALRWRAARDLGQLGIRGRSVAMVALRAIVEDPSLPITARANAARVLDEVAPSQRREVMRRLQELLDTPNLLHREQVLQAIGAVDPVEATVQLRTIANTKEFSAVTRIRCAEALVQLRRDQQDNAAVVARAVALDESVARHVRTRAARDLALWSQVCRTEARDLLRALS
ncbi:hypothetical protein GCM10029964_091940 [Kibdelosporangium lantanae]